MELLVNSIAGPVFFLFDAVSSNDALLSATAMAAGAYLGTRIALTRYDRAVLRRVARRRVVRRRAVTER